MIRMSHIVTIQTKLHDAVAVEAACQRLSLPAPVQGTVMVYKTQATGLIVRLTGWEFPAVIDVLTGVMRYDNFNGHWGDQTQLDRFMQLYAVEKAKLEARKKGYQVNEQSLQDGAIRLQIIEGV
jgi:hypothetical protein